MFTHRRAMLALVAAVLAVPVAASAKDPGISSPVTGTIVLSAKGAGVGVGYTWGDGLLRFHGKNYPFSVQGVTIADVGFSKISGRGRVYHLKRVEDFSGTYAAATGEATLVNGVSGQVLQNANGVQIRIDNVTRGARLQGSADGIKLTLK